MWLVVIKYSSTSGITNTVTHIKSRVKNMLNKINIRDVKISWLNVRCLTLISKYAKVAYEKEGLVINLQDPDVLQQVMTHARSCSDIELGRLYLNFRIELKNNLSEEAVAAKIAASSMPASLSSRPRNNAARFLRF